MRPLLKWLGLAGFVAILIWIVWDVLERDRSAPTRPAPPLGEAFPVALGPLGSGEVRLSGRTEMSSETTIELPDGSRRRVREVQVEGRNWRPASDDPAWMVADEVRIRRFDTDGRSLLFELSGPRARMAMRPETSRPEIDTTRPWFLERPQLQTAHFLGGRVFDLDAPEVQLDPRTGAIRCPGAFGLTSGGLQLKASDLLGEPAEDRLSFGESGEDSRVDWRFESEDGTVFSGDSDAGGSLQTRADGSQRLSLPAKERCHFQLPQADGLGGVLFSRGMLLDFREREGNFEAYRARGLETTRWDRDDSWLEGGPWTAHWSPRGEFIGVEITGPVLSQLEEMGGFGGARGGAFLAPGPTRSAKSRPGAIRLWGGSFLWNPDGRMQAEWMQWAAAARASERGNLEAGGGVRFDSPRATAWAEHLQGQGQGRYVLSGHALVHLPGEDLAQRSLATESVVLDEEGGVHLEHPVSMVASDSRGEWSLEAGELEHFEREGYSRTEARREVRWRTQDAVFEGDSLTFLKGERDVVDLRGRPAIGRLQLGGGKALLHSERFVLQDGTLILNEDPSLQLPAAVLGLQGEAVKIQAPVMRREPDGRWILRNGVEFSGGLTGRANRMSWSPETGMTLVDPRTARLEGQMASGERFSFEAVTLGLNAEGVVDLEENARAVLSGGNWGFSQLIGSESSASTQSSNTVQQIVLTGRNGHLAPSGGWFRESALVEAGPVRAGGREIEWTAEDNRLVTIRVIQEAWIESPEATGRGRDLSFQPQASKLRIEGTADQPAELQLADGRRFFGEWLGFDLKHRLVSAGRGGTRKTRP